ncbi:hypothetical protein LX36DRAFT_657349 [Colletotrichum falcatum]|nr:hypothetical protein LX36DRAFT_657349 [Colletotrichum falcatum]
MREISNRGVPSGPHLSAARREWKKEEAVVVVGMTTVQVPSVAIPAQNRQSVFTFVSNSYASCPLFSLSLARARASEWLDQRSSTRTVG